MNVHTFNLLIRYPWTCGQACKHLPPSLLRFTKARTTFVNCKYHYACSNARMASDMCWLTCTTVTQEGEVLWGLELMETVALTCTMIPLSSHIPQFYLTCCHCQLYISCTTVLEPDPCTWVSGCAAFFRASSLSVRLRLTPTMSYNLVVRSEIYFGLRLG